MALTKVSGDVIQSTINVGVITATRIDGNINSTGVSTFTTLKVTDVTATNILPPTDNTGVVGNASFTWSSGQFTNLTVDSTLNVRTAIDLADSDILRFGTGDDVQIFYNGTTNDLNIEFEASANQIAITDNGTYKVVVKKDGSIGIGTTNPTVSLDLGSRTDAIELPQGTTAQRPSGNNPYIRYNTTNSALEFYNGTDWVEIISDYFPSGSTILG